MAGKEAALQQSRSCAHWAFWGSAQVLPLLELLLDVLLEVPLELLLDVLLELPLELLLDVLVELPLELLLDVLLEWVVVAPVVAPPPPALPPCPGLVDDLPPHAMTKTDVAPAATAEFQAFATFLTLLRRCRLRRVARAYCRAWCRSGPGATKVEAGVRSSVASVASVAQKSVHSFDFH
jgi:hypothetical protein